MVAALIGMLAWIESTTLLPLLCLLVLPALIFSASNRLTAFFIALVYYAVGARDLPYIITIFFTEQSLLTSIAIWLFHASILSFTWCVAYQSKQKSTLRRTIGVLIALILLTIPPVGLFHWGSPLFVAGLLFPGLQVIGVLLTVILIISLTVTTLKNISLNISILSLLSLSLYINSIYIEPIAPSSWRAVSLEFGQTPKLWSDEMQEQRKFLVQRALHELDTGAKVVVFPEAITGSDHREQKELWQVVTNKAKKIDATVLVGEESWDGDRMGFKNALVGFGIHGNNGDVVVSSKVPMPVGDWKLGLQKGAKIDIFGSDLVLIHDLTVSFSMCYEDMLFWSHQGLLLGKADLMISSANQWPSSGTSSERPQDISRKLLARIAGIPLLTAKNH